MRPEAIGLTMMHEHLLFGLPGWHLDPTRSFDREAVFQKVTEEVKAFKAAGGSLLVDVTPIASGRDVEFLIQASKATGVHIVACTGFWSELGMPGHFQQSQKSVGDLEELFVQELTRGIGATNVPAGIIKVGTKGEHMSPLEKGLFQAAGRASKRTGAAVTTHVSSHLPSPVGVISGREQLKVLIEEEGVEPSRVIIGHCDAVRFPDYHREIVQAGAYVQFDHVCEEEGAAYSLPDSLRVQWVLALLEQGYERQMLLSSDRITHRLSRGSVQRFTLSSLVRNFLPALRKAGVGEKTIQAIMVENPRRALPMPEPQASARGGAR
jgi:phosphotriesterase-related protein